jgi:hypothetical protein
VHVLRYCLVTAKSFWQQSMHPRHRLSHSTDNPALNPSLLLHSTHCIHHVHDRTQRLRFLSYLPSLQAFGCTSVPVTLQPWLQSAYW